MGTLHLGRVVGAHGFARVVAIKRLFPNLAADRSFREMLLDEARFASRIRHPNVVPVLDVVEEASDLYIVMEYVHGLSLAQMLVALGGRPIPLPIALGIVEGVLLGLHAAHEARGEDGTPLGIVHRDVSPQNILVGADGVPRLIDFGIAKAATRMQVTDPGVLKGKVGYVAPEQLVRETVARQADVYSAGVVLWEMLAQRRFFPDADVAERLRRIDEKALPPPAAGTLDEALDGLVLRALERDQARRFPTAEAMALALLQGRRGASSAEIAKWLAQEAFEELEISEERVRLLEQYKAGLVDEAPEPASIAASVDPTRASLPAPPRRSRLGAWLAGAGVIALLAFFGGTAALRASHSAAPPAPPPAALVAPPPPQAAAIAPSSAPSSAPLPAPAASAPPPAPASAAPSVATVPPQAKPGKPPRHAAKPACDPPYTVDANGFKHYNRNCF
jgi:serine/threonine-protein kinase